MELLIKKIFMAILGLGGSARIRHPGMEIHIGEIATPSDASLAIATAEVVNAAMKVIEAQAGSGKDGVIVKLGSNDKNTLARAAAKAVNAAREGVQDKDHPGPEDGKITIKVDGQDKNGGMYDYGQLSLRIVSEAPSRIWSKWWDRMYRPIWITKPDKSRVVAQGEDCKIEWGTIPRTALMVKTKTGLNLEDQMVEIGWIAAGARNFSVNIAKSVPFSARRHTWQVPDNMRPGKYWISVRIIPFGGVTQMEGAGPPKGFFRVISKYGEGAQPGVVSNSNEALGKAGRVGETKAILACHNYCMSVVCYQEGSCPVNAKGAELTNTAATLAKAEDMVAQTLAKELDNCPLLRTYGTLNPYYSAGKVNKMTRAFNELLEKLKPAKAFRRLLQTLTLPQAYAQLVEQPLDPEVARALEGLIDQYGK